MSSPPPLAHWGKKLANGDHIVSHRYLAIDEDDEEVFVTARWQRASGLRSLGCDEATESVEERSLRLSDPLDDPENVLIAGQPWVTQKPYIRASFFALALASRPIQRLLLIGTGAGQLVDLWCRHLPRLHQGGATCSGLDVHCVELHAEVSPA